MSTVRLRRMIKKYLRTGPKNTGQILEYVNGRTRHGSTVNQLVNILAKDKEIRKVGSVRKKGYHHDAWRVTEWALVEEVEP